jgi:hypothetical protein
MKSLFLAWQSPNRAWFPVGRLDADVLHHQYSFRYTKGALRAEKDVGFAPLASFPDFSKSYESEELFPLFRNRVLDPNRKNFAEYLESLDLSPSESDPIQILAVTGGTRETDNLEVFPKIETTSDGSFACRFFLHGLRHMSQDAQARSSSLHPGESLGVSVELTNPVTKCALQLTTSDYQFIGWTPRYLVVDLLKAISERPYITAKVVRVNEADVPLNRRILVELRGRLPANFEPMSSEQFQAIEAPLAA